MNLQWQKREKIQIKKTKKKKEEEQEKKRGNAHKANVIPISTCAQRGASPEPAERGRSLCAAAGGESGFAPSCLCGACV